MAPAALPVMLVGVAFLLPLTATIDPYHRRLSDSLFPPGSPTHPLWPSALSAQISAALDALSQLLVVVPSATDVGLDRIVAGGEALAHAPVQSIDEATLARHADGLEPASC
jgi:hypothetical protein